ncbi:MAG: hypothetical protein HRU43_00205 [Simkaniaceae bacterium]|nr:hypothetical protein [Simkaniaceae bacterium]
MKKRVCFPQSTAFAPMKTIEENAVVTGTGKHAAEKQDRNSAAFLTPLCLSMTTPKLFKNGGWDTACKEITELRKSTIKAYSLGLMTFNAALNIFGNAPPCPSNVVEKVSPQAFCCLGKEVINCPWGIEGLHDVSEGTPPCSCFAS